MRSVSRKVHERLRKADEARLGPEAFGDPDEIADAMVAALPLGHVFDEIAGPFYDTAGLTRWLARTAAVTRPGGSRRIRPAGSVSCHQTEPVIWQPI